MMCTPEVRPKNLTLGVFFMVKYDEEFKRGVVDAYFAGEGSYASIAKIFWILSKTNMKKRVNTSKQSGKNGLIR